MKLTVLLLLGFAGIVCSDGQLRTRIQRRWPDCRGTIEGQYAGDEYGFFHRILFETAGWNLVILLEKDRGEEWIDLVSGGLNFNWETGFLESTKAGWLKAEFGSGLVLNHTGSWGGTDVDLACKPPHRRSRIELASGTSTNDGLPLTGVAAELSFSDFHLLLLQGYSRIDPVSGGYHRTENEIENRQSVTELLSALRISCNFIGFSIAAASESDAGDEQWQRIGIDWEFGNREELLVFGGELAVGHDSSGTHTAVMTGPSIQFNRSRQSLIFYSYPEGFPDERMLPARGNPGKKGIVFGARTRISETAISLSADLYQSFSDELSEGFTGKLKIQQEFQNGFESFLKTRLNRNDEGETSFLGTLGLNWFPSDLLHVSVRIHKSTFSSDSTTGSGNAAELVLKIRPSNLLNLKISCGTFNTDDYDSRVYFTRVSFPGQYSSAPVYGKGFLLQASVSFQLEDDMTLRSMVSKRVIDNAESIGSGFEETSGGSRTEAGIQIDYSF